MCDSSSTAKHPSGHSSQPCSLLLNRKFPICVTVIFFLLIFCRCIESFVPVLISCMCAYVRAVCVCLSVYRA